MLTCLLQREAMKATITHSFILYLISFVVASDAASKCTHGDFMKDPTSCAHFYQCDHGNPVRFACAPGTWFNPSIKVCDYPYKVKCEVDPKGQVSGGHLSSSNKSDSSASKCTHGDFLKDPTSCAHFYRCNYGRKVRFACGPGTWFNPSINVCDYPYNVECEVNPGGQTTGGNGDSSDQLGNNGYNGDSSEPRGQNTNPTYDNQDQSYPSNQGGSGTSLDSNDERYVWPIQDTDSGSNAPDGSNGSSSEGNNEERPGPTIDDLYNGNNNPYQE